MALPDFTTQDPATYKANIDSTAADHETKISGLNTLVLEIGDWNMTTTAQVNKAHGIDGTKIRAIDMMVRNDENDQFTPLGGSDSAGGLNFTMFATTLIVSMFRLAGGAFDNNASYDATSYNRGWIIIKYVD